MPGARGFYSIPLAYQESLETIQEPLAALAADSRQAPVIHATLPGQLAPT